MKKLGRVFFGVVCISFLFGCNDIQWVRSDNPIIEWDASTTTIKGEPIPAGYELRYKVYIDKTDDKTHDGSELLTHEPIETTRFQLPSLEGHKGKYFIGVQAIGYQVKDGKRIGKTQQSEISWSSSKSKTKKKPFGLKIK